MSKKVRQTAGFLLLCVCVCVSEGWHGCGGAVCFNHKNKKMTNFTHKMALT